MVNYFLFSMSVSTDRPSENHHRCCVDQSWRFLMNQPRHKNTSFDLPIQNQDAVGKWREQNRCWNDKCLPHVLVRPRQNPHLLIFWDDSGQSNLCIVFLKWKETYCMGYSSGEMNTYGTSLLFSKQIPTWWLDIFDYQI